MDLGTEQRTDYPLLPMLVNGGVRVELPTLCTEDLDLSADASYNGRTLCRYAFKNDWAVSAVLDCTVGSFDKWGKLAIPLIAWDSEHFCRFD